MVRHHYRSKDGLRAACDDHVFEVLRSLNTRLVEHREVPSSWRGPNGFELYVARSLADGSPMAGPIFDELVTMTTLWFERATVTPPDQRAGTHIRAVLFTAAVTSIPLLREHLFRALGIDYGAQEGGELLDLTLHEIASQMLMDGETVDHLGFKLAWHPAAGL